MSRSLSIAPLEYYHLYNRGVLKSDIFLDDRDHIRFLFLILHLQSPTTFQNMSRPVTQFVKSRAFNIKPEVINEIVDHRSVELVAFCLMPNHFHLIVRALSETGIPVYMQRVLTAYAKYLSTKYKLSGHVFQGQYQAVHIEDNDQLLYASAYLHKNPKTIGVSWETYQWSSFTDFETNRWGDLLSRDVILDQFDDIKDFQSWTKDTIAKELDFVESPASNIGP